MIDMKRFGKEVKSWVRDGLVEVREDTVDINSRMRIQGKYLFGTGMDDDEESKNLIPAEGILKILRIALGLDAKESGFYLALFSGNVDPAANWTAANFAANATEITSTAEGYSNSTRPVWTPAFSANGLISNFDDATSVDQRALFNVSCSTSINVAGAALLSSNVRGGTGGALISATRYPTVRQVYDGTSFYLGYSVELLDT